MRGFIPTKSAAITATLRMVGPEETASPASGRWGLPVMGRVRPFLILCDAIVGRLPVAWWEKSGGLSSVPLWGHSHKVSVLLDGEKEWSEVGVVCVLLRKRWRFRG